MTRPARASTSYTSGARFYDLFSGELIYRAGRSAGIDMLELTPGDTVLDLGCGTGLNFSRLVHAVGPQGRVIGLDQSADMLAVARRRIQRSEWKNVTLVRADATAFTLADIGGEPVDAALSTYAMSVIPDPAAAWDRMCAAVRPGGRICIVDMQEPTGAARVFAPLARWACALGGADITAHPWTMLERDLSGVRSRSVRGGHIQVRVGTTG